MHITQHGEGRIRERIGVPKRAVPKLAADALAKGKSHADFAGSMRRYLDGIFLEHRNATNMRVFAQHVFIFNGDTLITAWMLPPKFRNRKATS